MISAFTTASRKNRFTYLLESMEGLLKEEVDDANKAKEESAADVATAKADLELQLKINDDLQAEIDRLKHEYEALDSEVKLTKSNLGYWLREHTELEGENSNLKQTNTGLETEKEILEEQVADLKKANEGLEKSKAALADEFKRKINELKNELEASKALVNAKDTQLNGMEVEVNEAHQQQVERLQKAIDFWMKKYRTDKSYLEDEVYLARFVEKRTIGEKEKLKKHYRTRHVFPKNKIIRALKKKCLEAGINVDDVFET
jgi:chromosome segregation ATPase